MLSLPAPAARKDATPPALRELLTYWSVVTAWVLVISTLSGDPFSAANTNRYLDPILRFLYPGMTPAEFAVAHTVIRKAAHVVEFFVLGSLLYWALRRGRPPAWQTRHALLALGLAAAYALVDELHQALVPSRSSSLLDSGTDTLGAAISQVVIYLRHRLRRHVAGE